MIGPGPRARSERLLRIAAVLALIGLALVTWSILDPRPAPILVGLSIGQGFGVLSFVLFVVVVAADLRLARRLGRRRVEDDGPASTASRHDDGR